MNRPTITAVGVASPFGLGVDALWEGLLAGRCCFQRRDDLLADRSVTVAAVDDALLDQRLLAEDRTLALCAAALDQIVSEPSFGGIDRTRLGVCVASAQGAITRWQRQQAALRSAVDVAAVVERPDSAAPLRLVVERTGAAGPVANPSCACASGTAAVGLAAEWIRQGRCDAVIAGGVDALSTFVCGGFAVLRALSADVPRPFDKARDGLGLGEAAALLLLGRGEAQDRGVEICGWGMASDAQHITAPDPTGAGVARAIEAAMRDARLSVEHIDFISAHGTATVFNDAMEVRGLERVFGDRLESIAVHSIKGAIGHSLAAAGAVEAIVAAHTIGEGVISPTVGLQHLDDWSVDIDLIAGKPRQRVVTHALSTSSGFGGINVATVLSRGSRTTKTG